MGVQFFGSRNNGVQLYVLLYTRGMVILIVFNNINLEYQSGNTKKIKIYLRAFHVVTK
jgi:hypothetical protein